MTGMKEGAGEDPFAEDAKSRDSETADRDSGGRVVKDDVEERREDVGEKREDVRERREDVGESERENSGQSGRGAGAQATKSSSTDTGAAKSSSSDDRESLEIPYKLRRDSVQDGRSRVPLFLQAETKAEERDALRELEERFDDDVSLTDLREALVVVGLERLDEVEDQLEEWGYGMTFDA